MKSMMKKAIALVMFAALSITLAGCGGNEPDLPVSEMAYAEASGIMGGISNTDEMSAAEFMEMEDEEVEAFFKQEKLVTGNFPCRGYIVSLIEFSQQASIPITED